MKFKLATLLWVLTLVAVAIASLLWVQRERAADALMIKEAKQEVEALNKGVQEFARMELGKADYYRQKLSLFREGKVADNSDYVRFVRMPQELGGMQCHGLPFTWQWRFLIQDPNQFQLCYCFDGIPKEESCDIEPSLVNRSHLNLDNDKGVAIAGRIHMMDSSGVNTSELANSPVEIALYLRLEANESGGRLFVSYEIQPATDQFQPGTVYRGTVTELKPAQVKWLLHHASTSRGGWKISGFGFENGTHVPLLDTSFSLEQPTTLVKVRAKKEVGELKFEPYPDKSPGLLVWVQAKEPIGESHEE